jgi:ribosomal protein S27AE
MEAINMLGGCHGTDKLKTPTLEEKTCPNCGNIIEVFSIDTEVACDKCGTVVYNDIQSCVKWCKYAKLCVGEEMYNKLMKAYQVDTPETVEPPSKVS